MEALQERRIWDLPTRLLHWSLAALFFFSWWSAETHHMAWHRYSGYTILGLLVFRLYWGFAGSTSARFSSFVRGPRAFFDYGRQLLRRDALPSVGHNPMGGWSVLLLLGLLVVQITTGLFAVDTDGIESGPLSHFVRFGTGRALAEWHEVSFNLLLIAVGLHLAAIAYYLFWKRQNLIAAMIKGSHRVPAVPALHFVGIKRAIPGVILATIVVAAIARGLRF